MADDFSDILGSDSLPVRREFSLSAWSAMSFLKYVGWALGAVVTYVILVLGWNSFSKARERAYRLSMRRRHGIPDNDHRPFNVAYAAVRRSRQEKERPVSALQSQGSTNTQTAHEARPAQAEQIVRNRGEGPSAPQLQAASPSNFPGQCAPAATEQLYPSLPTSEAAVPPPPVSTSPNRVLFADGYNTSLLRVSVPDFPERPVRKTNGILKSTHTQRKRGLEEEPVIADNSKKSRVEGDEFIDGDEEAGWQNSASSASKRGNKRGFGDEPEGDSEEIMLSEWAREKRPRKVSRGHEAVASDEDMEVDEDEIAEVLATPRGRKRDRVEAGPSFNEEDEAEEVEPKSRGRKRRNKRRSDVGVKLRGTKRERDINDEEMLDIAEESSAQLSRKKRGKRAQAVQEDEDEHGRYANISIDVSPDRANRREIGEEWESNGVRYKVGPNGQRLRQALIKKAGQRYIMPKDSQHPDREANIEVCVEKWLTEDEFREAKQQRLLAWQDLMPNKSSEPSTPSSEVPPSPSSGKHLLWNSTGSPKFNSLKERSGKPSSQQSQSAVHQSVATTIGLQPTFRRRITSAFTPTSPSPTPPSPGTSLTDSTNGSPRQPQKVYSKWEKQDLEAKAMVKMREANQKKREEKEALDRLEKEKKEKLKASVMPQPTIPTISVTKPAESDGPKSTFALGGVASGSSNKPAFSLASAAPLGSVPQPSLASAPPLGSMSAPSSMSIPPLGSTPASNSAPLDGASKPVTTSNPFFKQPSAPNANKAALSFAPSTSSPLATNSPTRAPEKPQAPGLGFPSTINPAPIPASVSTPATSSTPAQPVSKFSFSQNVSTSSAPTNSLLARMGPPQQQQQQSAPAAAQAAQKPPTSFSFSTPPATQSSTPSSSFFNKPAEPTSKPALAPAPKFNFSINTPTTKPNVTSSSLSGALGPTSQPGSSKPAEPSSNFGTFPFVKPPTTTGIGSSAPSPNAFGAVAAGKFNFGTKESSPMPAATPAAGSFSTQAQGQPSIGTPGESTSAPSTSTPAFSGFAGKSAFGTPKEPTPAPAPASTSTPAFGGFGTPANSPFGASKESTPGPAVPSSTPAASTFNFGAPKESTPAVTAPAAPSFGGFGTAGQSAFGTPKESTPLSTIPATSAFGGIDGADKSNPFSVDSSKPVFGSSSGTPSSAFGKSGLFGAAAKEKDASGPDSNVNGTTSTYSVFGTGSGTPSSAFGKSGLFGAAAAAKEKDASGSDDVNGTMSAPSAPTFASSLFSSPFGKAAQGSDSGTLSAFGTNGAFGAAATKGAGPDFSSAQVNVPTTFTFGSSSSPSPFGKPAQSDPPKPVFSFGTGSGTGTTPTPSAGGTSSFASKPAVFDGGSGSTTPSVFGAAAEKK